MIESVLVAVGLAVVLAFDLLTFAARSAYLNSSHARLLALREQTDVQIDRAAPLLYALPRLLASLNLTLVWTRFLLAVGVLLLLSFQPQIIAGVWVAVVRMAVTLFVAAFLLFWLEWQVDRRIAVAPERWALRFTPFARVLMPILALFVAIPLATSHTKEIIPETAGTVTEDELKTLVDAGQEEGVFEQGERRMIYSIFQLSDTLAREIMIPRIDILALDVNTPLEQAVDALLRSGHSRAPVYEDTVDNTLGLLYAKDLLRVWREGNQIASLRALLRPAYFVPEAKHLDELLGEMQSQRIHMAMVVDEYGGVAGLVTLEDIVEEILGEIRDEYDQSEEAPYQALKNGDYIFQGRVDLDDFNETMGADLPKEEADTLGGYIYSRLGRVPAVGETVSKDALRLTVEQVSARRIRKVRACWVQPDENNREENSKDGDR